VAFAVDDKARSYVEQLPRSATRNAYTNVILLAQAVDHLVGIDRVNNRYNPRRSVAPDDNLLLRLLLAVRGGHSEQSQDEY
jgi:hypothetical protein